jgi:Protein of unknown function (DUF4038)/Putative collagen-binding domain of a collagenase
MSPSLPSQSTGLLGGTCSMVSPRAFRFVRIALLGAVGLAGFCAGCGGGSGTTSGGGGVGTGAGGSAPSVTSASQTTMTEGAQGAFTATTSGSPTPSISMTGALPSGVSFKDNGNGTGTLAGTPAAGTHGVYATNITAQNGVLPNGVQSFTLTVIPAASSAIVYPLKASANQRYLVDQNNKPVILLGDSPQSMLVNLNTTDMATYMSDRQARGFNAILVMVLCDSATAGNANGQTFDGVAPFTSGSSPANYDLSTPNPTYFARLDSLVSTAAADGLVVVLDPIETAGWLPTLENNGATKDFNYGAFLGNRYKNSPNIVWQSGNDFQDWNSNPSDNNLAFQVMAGIKSADPNHVQTIELDYRASYSNQDTATMSSVLGMDAVYTYFETYDESLQAYNSSPTLPAFLTEGNYEFENATGAFTGTTGVFILREQEYWTMTSGGCGQLYGNHYTWTFVSGWQNFLGSPGTIELAYWTKLFSSVDWWKLVPDQNHQVVTAGFGTYDASNLNLPLANYTTTAWITDGSVALSYDPAGLPLTVNLANFSGPVSAAWYDPSNGTFTPVAGSPFTNSGSRSFPTPGVNHDGDTDWVLALEVNPAFASNRARSRHTAAPARQQPLLNSFFALRR